MGEKTQNILTSADQILAIDDRVIELVEVPEWRGQVYVRSLTANERGQIEGAAAQFKETEGKDATFAATFTWRVAAMAICDEKGDRLFSDKKMEQLAEKNADAVGRVSEVAQRLSGLSVEDLEEMEKN